MALEFAYPKFGPISDETKTVLEEKLGEDYLRIIENLSTIVLSNTRIKLKHLLEILQNFILIIVQTS